MMDVDDENIKSDISYITSGCFRCGAMFDIKPRKRKINGKWNGTWDGKNYFCNACNFRKGKALTDEQKIVTLSLIAIRAFSKVSCVDLRKEEVRKELKDVIDITYEKLKEWDLIKLKIGRLYDMSGIEHPIANLFRIAYSDDLQDKTIGLAKKNDRIYYLDAFDERSEIFNDNINSLFRLIIYDKEVIKNEEMNCVQVSESKSDIFNYSEELCSLCLYISDSKSPYIFKNPYEHIFSSPKYDNILIDIIKYL